ncbi:MAG: cadherin repeat domain-containing protein, partial [Ekhidna sp.]|nr:cadherin repeat domain-containing protein [Ekhidna sp.]
FFPPPPPLFFLRIVLFSAFGLALVACGDDDEPEKKPDKGDDTPANTAPTIANQTFSIAEDAVISTPVGTIKATDAEDDDLTFSITSGNTGDVFAIAGSTGAITVAGSLDFETTSTYTLKVSVSDGELSSTADITVNVTDVEEPGTRLPAKDINALVAAGNIEPQGLWSDGTTIWVADDDNDKLYAYTLTTGARDAAKEFDLVASNRYPEGLWSDETTIWIADDNFGSGNPKLYAYTLATGVRDAAKEFDLATGNTSPSGIWSDKTTIWVADENDLKLYAYTLATGARDAAKEFNLAEDNISPRGLWSDGTTIWVLELSIRKLYAYTLTTGTRDAAKEFDLVEESKFPYGLWSDGTTIWVTGDDFDDNTKLYAYRLK